MTRLNVVLDFVNPSFHGLRGDGRPDWPPSPLRLCAALMAGCHPPTGPDGPARTSLEALVHLAAPDIWTPRYVEGRVPATYSPRSGQPRLGAKGTLAEPGELGQWVDLSILAMHTAHRTLKPQDRVHLDGRRLIFAMDDPCDSVDVEALDRAARRVPYVGRSHDVCDVTVTRIEPEAGGDTPTVRWAPMTDPTGRTRGWRPESLAWMDHNHELTTSGSTSPLWPAEPYSTPLRYTAPSALPPLSDTVLDHVRILPFRRGRPSGTTPLILDGLPSLPDVRVFPCVVVGHANATGRLLGIGLTTARGRERLDIAERVLRSQNGLDLAGPDAGDGRDTLRSVRWVGPARRWSSATPLRAFPDERVVHHVVGAELGALAGAGRIVDVTRIRTQPWQRRWRQPGDGLDQWWVAVEFDDEVTGPLQLGAATSSGYGLFVPEGRTS